MRKVNFILFTMTFTLGFFLFSLPVFAGENVEELKAQIEALQKRVEELGSTQTKVPKPTQQPRQTFPNQNRFNRSWDGGWDPFEEMGRMQEEMNKMFQQSFSRSGFPGSGKGGMFKNNMFYDEDFDIQETKDGYEIKFDVSGLDKDNIEIEINENSITISGERSAQTEESDQNGFYSSRSFGSFLKTVPLPVDADTQKMETKKEGDMLVIKMPKKMYY